MRDRQKRVSLLIVTLVFLSIFYLSLMTLPKCAMAWTYYVGGTGPGNFTTIQAAVDAAGWEGGIIYVYNGTYHEHVHVGTYSLSLIGENRNTTIVMGDQTGYGFRITNHHVHISGLTITNFSMGITFETYFEYHDIRNNTISNCGKGVSITDRGHDVVVADNTISMNFVGIDVLQSTGNTIINNTISMNSIGINLPESTSNTITNNNIFSNRLDGIYLTNSKWNTISGNTIWDNWDGIYLTQSTLNIISENTLLSNLDGIDLSYSSNGNIITNNLAANNRHGVYVYSSTSNTIYHNDFIDNAHQAYDSNTNSWDGGYPVGGNYWSEYVGVDKKSGSNQDQPGGDGIGDTSHDIPGGTNKDRYPLMNAHLSSVPSSPEELQAMAANGYVTLTWEPPTFDGFSAVVGYRIYRGTSSGAETFLVEIGDVLTYVDTGLTNGQTYYYQVSAMNGVGEGPRSSEVSATPILGPTVPSAPRNTRAFPEDQQITLTWSAPAYDGGSAISNYRIYRGTIPGGETFLVDPGNVLTYVDTGLTNGQTYYYEVSAVNGVGEGARSNETNATPSAGPALGDPPHILPNESADPDMIWLEGSSVFPQETTITLNITGAGIPIAWNRPQDTVFVIDTTGSMEQNDPSYLRLSGAKTYVDMMKNPDRVATVWFSSYGYLANRHHLTSDYDQVKIDIDSIPPPYGVNNGSLGLRIGTDELIGYGDPNHTRAEVLISDGAERYWGSYWMIEEAQRAADMGVTIHTVGLNPPSPENEALLQQIADITGGEYYYAPTGDALENIYIEISRFRETSDIAGKKIDDPVEPNPMVRDVLPPYIHFVPGTFQDWNGLPCPPDAITVNLDGSTVLDWDVERILINESWVVEFDVTSSMGGYVPVGIYPLSRVNYSKWDDSTTTVPFPEVFIYVMVPGPIDPPVLRIDTDQNDVYLHWTVPGPNISHYLIYRATDQRGFDFSNPVHNTSSDSNPLATYWTDLDAAGPSSPREYYYVVRAVTQQGMTSSTSNTAGKWTSQFEKGTNAFSLPLEPFENTNTSWYTTDVPNLSYIRWMNTTGHWVTHIPEMGEGVNDKQVEMGEGFEISLTSNTTYTFVGSPASMIRFHEGLGDSVTFRKSLSARTEGNDVNLSWQSVAGASRYIIFRSERRDGLHNLSLSPIAETVWNYWQDPSIIGNEGSEYYYMVIPMDPQGELGSSTYSIGVFTEIYQAGTDTFALPLKPVEAHSLDWYCDNIPNIVGIIHLMKRMWRLHAIEMPEGVYDADALQGEGYQISTDSVARFIFIGY